MHNYLKIIFTVILFIFSFYYTNKGIEWLKEKDPLMQEIITNKTKYNQEPIDAIITVNTIIPGHNGLYIDPIKSYDKMKKLGVFNESLLVYKEIIPNKSYYNNYNKVIISGNPYKNNLSLIFNINDISLLYKINTILNNYNLSGNYYFTNNFLKDHIDDINKIDNINILVHNLSNLDNLTTSINYCLNESLLKTTCHNQKIYTILANIKIENYHLTYTKNNIKNGSIILYTFNNQNSNTLSNIIKYIINNNYHIVSLEELLKE